MTKSFAQYISVYIFVVLMILLRPYLAYQISMKNEFARDPERVSRLLQRLVKKKEWHIDDREEAIELISASDVEIVLPVLLLLLLCRRLSWLFSSLADAAENLYRSTVFQVSPANHYYQLLSSLRI